MRINKFLAAATDLSRRSADIAILEGRVLVNDQIPTAGYDVQSSDTVTLDKQLVSTNTKTTSILFNKPSGYVVSRNGQGSRTIYELLPPQYKNLQPVGRLDKESSGLLLLTNDGQLAHDLTHPSKQKNKIYEITLDKPLQPLHRQMISDNGLMLSDGISKLQLERLNDNNDLTWRVTMHEGRNRQIRRTFIALNYRVIKLHRTNLGDYALNNIPIGETKKL